MVQTPEKMKLVHFLNEFTDKESCALLIVTADQKTEGFSILEGNLESGKVELGFFRVDQTGIMDLVFACGWQADNFGGVYPKTEIWAK